jgi:hypothetical protein
MKTFKKRYVFLFVILVIATAIIYFQYLYETYPVKRFIELSGLKEYTIKASSRSERYIAVEAIIPAAAGLAKRNLWQTSGKFLACSCCRRFSKA